MKNLVLLCAVGFMSACASTQPVYHAKVDSINDPVLLVKKKYILLPGNADIKPEDLLFREFSNYINKALSDKGYKKVENPDDAELIIFAFYGVSDPKTFSYTYSYPIFGKISGGHTDYTLTTFGKSGTTTTFGTATTAAQYGVVGTNVGTSYDVVYFRYLTLDAIDYQMYKKSEKFISAWKTMVSSVGSSGDLRLMFPVLATAAKRYLGSDTRQQIRTAIGEEDEDLVGMRYANNFAVATSKPLAGVKQQNICDYYYCLVDLSGDEQKISFGELIKTQNTEKLAGITKIAKTKIKYCHPENTPSAFFVPEEKLSDNEAVFLEYLCKSGFIK